MARSECVTDNYDQMPPSKITGNVTNSGLQFEWASDFDRRNGTNYVWHYIKNAPESQPLNFNWKKTGLKQEFVRPLPPGETACAEYPVSDLSESDIDDDAPIVYGHNNRVQRAAIYGKKAVASADEHRYRSKLSSSYIDETGGKRDFEVSFFYDSDGDTVTEMGILAPDDLYVGIANVGSYWSEETIGSLAEAAKLQKADFDYQSLPVFASKEASSGAFFEDWVMVDEPATIVRGTVKDFGAGNTSGVTGLTELVVFDERRKPIASTFVALPVTKSE